MKREIKFRAYLEGRPMEYFGLRNGYPANWSGWDTVMQFTGLLDSKGKEIYEGDIVTCVGGYETTDGSSGECEHPRLVEWSKEGTLQIVASCEDCKVETPLYEFDLDKIIGNIYTDSHLLKDTK